jgi:hypothetical protein
MGTLYQEVPETGRVYPGRSAASCCHSMACWHCNAVHGYHACHDDIHGWPLAAWHSAKRLAGKQHAEKLPSRWPHKLNCKGGDEALWRYQTVFGPRGFEGYTSSCRPCRKGQELPVCSAWDAACLLPVKHHPPALLQNTQLAVLHAGSCQGWRSGGLLGKRAPAAAAARSSSASQSAARRLILRASRCLWPA